MLLSNAYHHVHCSGWHDWFQAFDIAYSSVELFRVSLYKAAFNNCNKYQYGSARQEWPIS